MKGSDVINISRTGTFTVDQVNKVLPVIRRFTQDYSQSVDALVAKLESLDNTATDQIKEIEQQINNEIREWQRKVRKLGGFPKGLWLVDFDSGDGHFCWKYPESEILYWHQYTDGFTKRVPLHQKQEPVTKNTEVSLSSEV